MTRASRGALAEVEGRTILFPSLRTDVVADIQGDLATVTVTQTFANPTSTPLNAKYLFPLDKNVAVFAMTMEVGEEIVQAKILPRSRVHQKTTVAFRRCHSMHFDPAFDVAQAGYKDWWFPAVGLTFIALGAAILRFPRYVGLIFSGSTSRATGWALLIFASVWTLATFSLTYYDYMLAGNALLAGDYNVVEGPVTDFIPMRHDGKGGPEKFTIAGQQFSYSDYSITPGFNNTRSHGGPIDAGVYVRVRHKGNTILRLEIAR